MVKADKTNSAFYGFFFEPAQMMYLTKPRFKTLHINN